MTIITQTNRYQELDALRGIACLMVVFFHYTMGRPEANLGFDIGVTGVDLFFIISGFVIFMSLNKISQSKDFIINRVSRLYPTYWSVVTFTYLLKITTPLLKYGFFSKKLFRTYLGNMTMFQFYLRVPDLDGPYWTMIIEMIFYIIILALYHFRLLRYITISFLTFSIASVIITQFFYEHSWAKNIFSQIPLLQFIPLFFAGVTFYKIYTDKTKYLQNYSIIVFCLLCQLLLFPYGGLSHFYINYIKYSVILLIYFTAFILFVNHKLNFMVNRTTLFLGKISFALYLVHQCISIDYVIPYCIEKFHMNFWLASFCIALPLVMVIATIITYYIEVPMSRKMKAIFRSRPAPVLVNSN